ncbi:uncharacterized protein LOC128988336 [Macrosteles quadrilineatus]|uniref:uncharacterized protein LOC128988336 n=1 Tax=Macrosteles quadrilineatus TaxID=74068 RepID=UPI0023E13B56|nr:uncharacterized protein LOC128988336 [Macrosteles quadrilineatus]
MLIRISSLLVSVLCIPVLCAPQEDESGPLSYEILSSSHSNVVTPLSPDGLQTLTVHTEVHGSEMDGQATSNKNTTYLVNNNGNITATTLITNNMGNNTMTYVVNSTTPSQTERPQYYG